MIRLLGIAGLSVTVLVAAAYWTRTAENKTTFETASAAAPRPSTGAPENGTKIGEAVPFTTRPTTEPGDPGSMLRLPDGSYVPPLNGIQQPQPMIWKHGSFTAIVATERTSWQGLGELDWYVHQDGARSTTLMTGVDGVRQPVTIVLHTTSD